MIRPFNIWLTVEYAFENRSTYNFLIILSTQIRIFVSDTIDRLHSATCGILLFFWCSRTMIYSSLMYWHTHTYTSKMMNYQVNELAVSETRWEKERSGRGDVKKWLQKLQNTFKMLHGNRNENAFRGCSPNSILYANTKRCWGFKSLFQWLKMVW